MKQYIYILYIYTYNIKYLGIEIGYNIRKVEEPARTTQIKQERPNPTTLIS
jgi:hypothetical protein